MITVFYYTVWLRHPHIKSKELVLNYVIVSIEGSVGRNAIIDDEFSQKLAGSIAK